MNLNKKLFKLDTNENIQESWDIFIDQENKSRELIILKKNYVDLINDLVAGLLLHQIVFWFLPSKENKSKLRVVKNGEKWLAKSRTDWWDEIRISPKQYDRAMSILRDAYIVDTQLFKFSGNPTVHIKLNRKILLGLLDGDKIRSRNVDEAKKQKEAKDEKERLKEIELNKKKQGVNPILTKGENPISPKVEIHLPQRGKSYKHRLHTEDTNIEHSKECSSNSDGVAQKSNEFTNQESTNLENKNSIPNSDLDNSPLDTPKVSKIAELRKGAKSIKQKKKQKKEFAACPLEYEPYMEAFEKYTDRHFRSRNESYFNSWVAIEAATKGEFFNTKVTSSVDKSFYKDELSLDNWIFALKRFSIMRNNSDYSPSNKTSINNITPYTFLYNRFNKRPEVIMNSYFLFCLKYEPQLLAPKLKDQNPDFTNYIIKEVKKRYGWDLSNGDRNTAIRCTKKLTEFFEKNKSKIHLFDIHFNFTNQKVNALLETLEKNESADYPMKANYLCGDMTYNKFLPEYLKRVGSMS